MLSVIQLERLQVAAENAVACEGATQVPAELTVAQWALESGWGTHQPGNNCFGIKAYEGCYGCQVLDTTEVDHGIAKELPQEFATFPNLAACFEKHAQLICQGAPYAHAWCEYQESKNLERLICGIAPVYSTSPRYATLLMELIGMHAIERAIWAARHNEQMPPALVNA
ncbi:MAG TPA: glucosaminidase domain-containing protein [Bryobacteraceae bacterium]|nr:glucosaminidase domain-containing protein [Bryobacteraceae bacterium]